MFKEFFDRVNNSAIVVYLVQPDGHAKIYRTATGNVDVDYIRKLESQDFRPAKVMLNGRYDDCLICPTLSKTIAVARAKCKLDEFLPTFYVCGGKYESGFDIEVPGDIPYVYVLHPYRNGLTTYAVHEDGTIVAAETGFLCGPKVMKLSEQRIQDIQKAIQTGINLMIC